ncbi:DUF4124 domain-containing protein [Crenobacter sp. SG2305]|uniref:DUF4124 domain-containing protein n=1 Tax=Crenobacter oryzisoli TaxID=3056844 RepID=UPI0025AA9C89|nr:DUF4124 domain-containing protein [Crenobacter sp. SG2305]MDN0084468.1 DUF4124 domain-containing protein [Crenobacter sp. SG2305]
MKRLLALTALLATCVHAAPVYKYVDQSGNVTYTNVPVPGAQQIKLPPLQSDSPRPTPLRPRSTSGNAASGAVQIAPSTQKQRDAGRRQILEQELSNERKALTDARQALADGQAVRNGNERNYAKYQERIQKLQDAVTEREKNIQALQQELAR